MCSKDQDYPFLSSTSSTELYNEPCELTFYNLKTVPVPGCQFALKDVSGVAKPGQILAVMGPTGCGKTTLLNTISDRVPIESGSIWVNGEPISRKLRRTKIGYVLQHDVFFATLTLKQTLIYTALLRLSDKFSYKQKIQKVEDIIGILGLYECQHNPVGDDAGIRGVSGGEKKRLSIACELITNPSVLLIDEPTSGLDSFTAIHLIKTLKNYAQKTYKNVILTVHQPSSRMFQMFDSLLALSNGQTAYFGPISQMTTHMGNLGLPIEPNYNPADFLLEKLKDDEQKVIKAWNSSYKTTKDLGNPLSLRNGIGGDKLPGQPLPTNPCSWPTSFLTQVKVLSRRNVQLAIPRVLGKVNWIQTLSLAIFAGLTWFQIARDEENVTNLEGWMFFSSNFWMLYVLFQALWAFPPEKPIVAKERKAGAYRFSSYYIAKILGELPLEVMLPAIYFIISYLMIGGTVLSFCCIMVSQMLSSVAAQSVGLFFGSVFAAGPAMTTASIFTVAAQLLGGYLTTNVPNYLKIFSLVYNGLRNMQIIEYYLGQAVVCAPTSAFASCNSSKFIDPAELLRKDETGFMFPLWTHALVLVSFIVVFRTLAFFALKRHL